MTKIIEVETKIRATTGNQIFRDTIQVQLFRWSIFFQYNVYV